MQEFQPNYKKLPSAGPRFLSALLDQVLGFVPKLIVWSQLLIFIGSLTNRMSIDSEIAGFFRNTDFILSYIFISSFFYLKDVFDGRSVGKRTLGLQIVHAKTGETASPVRTVVRSIGYIVWPVELILTLVNPARRLGDIIAGTQIINYNKAEKKSFSPLNHLFAIIIAIGISASSYLPWLLIGYSIPETPLNIPDPYYRTEEVKEKPVETDSITAFFKNKYPDEFESVLLSSQGIADSDASLISGSFMLRKDLFATEKTEELADSIKGDFAVLLKNKKYALDVSIVYLDDEEPKQKKIEYSNFE